MKMLRLLFALTLLCGVIYPLAVTLIAQSLFAHKANGSLLLREQRPIGSALLAQKTIGAQWFHPRPSAGDYATVSSVASQASPTHKKFLLERQSRQEALAQAADDAWTTSASGLDPDLSPATAYAQIPRIAAARQMANSELHALVTQHIQAPVWGIWGRPRVNVLVLNLALAQKGSDAQHSRQTP